MNFLSILGLNFFAFTGGYDCKKNKAFKFIPRYFALTFYV